MTKKVLSDLRWYRDEPAMARGEPGIRHSFMASLATVLNHAWENVDPVWLMGSSAFAFRIWIAENFCPSCMSVFAWESLLPTAVQQSGYDCTYISRMWEEEDKQEERRRLAHKSIVRGINRAMPAIVWDIDIPEWGVLFGYDDEAQVYRALNCAGKPCKLAYSELGQRDIEILSVTIPGGPNQGERTRAFYRSVEMAVDHSRQKLERPAYQDGLPGYEQWAVCYERWALLSEAGKMERVDLDVPSVARYYAETWYGARCYARDYLRKYGKGREPLLQASNRYAQTADLLRTICTEVPEMKTANGELLRMHASKLREARAYEGEAVGLLEQFLEKG